MSSWRQHALIDAPPEAVWRFVGDPRTYPQWAGDVISLTGLPTITKGAEFEQTSRGPTGRTTSTFRIEELEELREIKMRCQSSGYYSHWLLTPARGSTFVEVEIGIEPSALQYRLIFGAVGKRYFRRMAQSSLDGIRAALSSEHPPAGGSADRAEAIG